MNIRWGLVNIVHVVEAVPPRYRKCHGASIDSAGTPILWHRYPASKALAARHTRKFLHGSRGLIVILPNVHNLRLGIDGGDRSLAVKRNRAALGICVAVVIVIVA